MISILPSEDPSNSATVIARPRSLALNGALRLVRPVPRGPQPAAIFAHLRAIGPMLGFERQTPQRIDERAAPTAGDDSHRHWNKRRAIGGRSRFINGAAGQRRHRGNGVDIGGLALIGRHAERGVALQVLDGDVALTRGERDVLQRHVVLEIDPAPPFVVGLWPGGLDCVMARRRVRRGALAAAGRVPLAQRLRKREGAVRGAGDGEVFDLAHGDEGDAGLVIAQASARLRVKMHRRRPPAREQQSVAVVRPPEDAHGFDASRSDDAFDGGAVRYAQRGCDAGSARVDNLDFRAGLSQGLGHGIGAVVVRRDDHALADQHAEALEIDERRVGGHHARPIVVGNDERPLDRAGCDHDLFAGECARAHRALAARRSQAQTRLPS